MELSKQVCSLESAKRLKELGVEQDSYFYWNTDFAKVVDRTRIVTAPIDFGDRYISAFTVAELGEMLPPYSYTQRDVNLVWMADLVEGALEDSDIMWKAVTEAEARARMLIYLLENGLLSLTKEENK